MQPILHQYKLRLTNLSQSNRSLKLLRLSPRRDLDLMALNYANKEPTTKLLEKILGGKDLKLIQKLSARDEEINLLDKRLNKIYRSVTSVYEETGAYDLYVGYPFVEGKFLEGSLARCPVMLFPVKLIRNFQGSPRWRLEINEEQEVQLNKTFFLAFEKFQQTRFPKAFWETEIPRFKDLQEYLNWFYAFLKEHQVEVNFNSDLFRFQVAPFLDKKTDFFNAVPTGTLKFQPYAVMGIFPQSDSSLLKDYEVLERQVEDFDLKTYLSLERPTEAEERYIKEENRFFVAPVDQSQEEALLKVKNGKSVVIHGPPGTGKSQVILNLVADGMASGKKVLVVSQKRAALDVVYHRLAELGLNRFVSLVHDYRSDRNQIYAHIRRQVEDIEKFKEEGRDLNVTKWEHDFRQASKQIDEQNRFFEGLYDALVYHREVGMTIHDLYLQTDVNGEILPLKELAKRFDLTLLEAFLDKMKALLGYLDLLKVDYPWRFRLNFQSFGFEKKQAISNALEKVESDISSLHNEWSKVAHLKEISFVPAENEERIAVFRKIGSWLESEEMAADLGAILSGDPGVRFAGQQLKEFETTFAEMGELVLMKDMSWNKYLELKKQLKIYGEKKGDLLKLFSQSYRRAKEFIEVVLLESVNTLTDENVLKLQKETWKYELLAQQYLAVKGSVFFSDLPLTGTHAQKLDWLARKKDARKKAKEIRSISFLKKQKPKAKLGEINWEHWKQSQNDLLQLERFSNRLKDQTIRWRECFAPEQIAALLLGIPKPETATQLIDDLKKSFKRDFEDIRSLDRLMGEFSPLEKKVRVVLMHLIEQLESESAEAFLAQIKNSIFLSWIEQAEERDPELVEVSSRRFGDRAKNYQETLEARRKGVVDLIQRLVKQNILDRIEYNRLKNPVTYREIAHQVSKKRRIWPVRKLISTCWEEGLSTLMPVWMASPESVSAIFPMVRDYFDLVIFDEASQCYVERAIPVLLRGKATVVAGDDKQLPPFDLYSVKAEADEEAFFENEMALEVESILDLAKNVLPEQKLNWHYRSREEALINFSNHAFYEGRLNVVPPAKSDGAFLPAIEWVSVSGEWAQNRNKREAKRVVELLETWILAEDPPSVGVVTFNFHQMEEIKDQIDLRIQHWVTAGQMDTVKKWYAALERGEGEERTGIFVKNIENVQGDERDVIIFSIAYAKNEKGKLISQFGSLSQAGGENRLNVAITRAKKKIMVLCSFNPEELQVENSRNPGPKLFKQYLLYARAVGTAEETKVLEGLPKSNLSFDEGEKQVEDQLADRVARDLLAHGISLDREVGDTNYKIDIAIKSPKKEGNYLLGIECEGKNYFNGKTPKEREVYRPELLGSRGWKIYRVWARNYFLSPEKEVGKILEMLGKEPSS